MRSPGGKDKEALTFFSLRERNISFRVVAPVRKKNRNGPYSSLPYLIVAAAAVAIPLVFQYCNRLKNFY